MGAVTYAPRKVYITGEYIFMISADHISEEKAYRYPHFALDWLTAEGKNSSPKISHSMKRDMHIAISFLMSGGDSREKAIECVLTTWFMPDEISEHPELREAIGKIADKVYK